MNSPLVSIIVCCRNEAPYIEKCLESLINQKKVKESSEILIIDGMSEDGTREIIKKFAVKNKNIKLFDNAAQIKPPAVNIGFKNALGKFLAICDAHTTYDEDYISNCLILMEEHPEVICVGGPIVSLGNTSFGKANALAMSSILGVGNAKHRFPDYEGYAEMACFPLFRREVLEKVGYYDEYFVINHDDEYCYRLRKSGEKVYLSPKAKSYYYVRDSIFKLFRQYFSYGFWQIAFLKKHKIPISLRQLIPFTFFSIIFLLTLISILKENILIGMVVPLIYFIALISASIHIFIKFGSRIAINYPLAIFTLHFSYASGFLIALFRFNLGKQKFK